MLHNLPLVTTIATALGVALLLGVLAVRVRIPAIVGYLLAGVLVGPFTPGIEVSGQIAAELAEIGIMLLMFGVGLHFSVDDLLRVRHITVPGASLQIAIATALGFALAASWGWSSRIWRWCWCWCCCRRSRSRSAAMRRRSARAISGKRSA